MVHCRIAAEARARWRVVRHKRIRTRRENLALKYGTGFLLRAEFDFGDIRPLAMTPDIPKTTPEFISGALVSWCRLGSDFRERFWLGVQNA